MNYPDKLNELISYFELLPGIGKKTAERLALHIFLEFSKENINRFSEALTNLSSLSICPKCHSLSELNQDCHICRNPERDQQTILVVESVKEVLAIERTKGYFGLYHVLNGAINFANNIDIKTLNIESLLNRVKTNNVKEVILATSLTTSGQLTNQYLKEVLKNTNCELTILAQGIPVGADITYTDEITLNKAISARSKF